MSWRRKNLFLITLVSLIILNVNNANAQQNPSMDFRSKIDLSVPVDFKHVDNIVSFNDDNISVRKILRELASLAQLNILLDDSVKGNLSVALNNVSVKEALDYIKNLAGLQYTKKGNNILLVTTKSSAKEKGLTKVSSKIIPIKYVNSKFVATLLNNTIFLPPTDGLAGQAAVAAVPTEGVKKATAEFRTNSVILVGTNDDIQLAEELIGKIDLPREVKTFEIHHASAVEVAQLLQASVFNDGVSPFNADSGTGDTSGLPSKSSPVKIDIETFQEGTGSSQVQGSAGGSSTSSQQQIYTLRSKAMSSKEIKIAPDGPIIVPDTRTNSITIMGTVDQIALAESIIPTLDQKLPQVAIETSLVEIFEQGLREIQPIIGTTDGQFAVGFNDAVTPATPTAGEPATSYRPLIGLPTVRDNNQQGTEFAWTTKPITRSSQVIAQLDAIIAKRNGKLLANPTVIAVHNSEAIISITEEIVRTVQITRDSTGFTQSQVQIGEAGIILNILPKISGDGFINLRIRPSVSTIAGVVVVGNNGIATLLNKRDLAVQEVRLANGQTLSLGGLIQERDTSTGSGVPGISSMPLIGALFRSTSKDLQRSELIMLVTPKILQDCTPMNMSRLSSINNDQEVSDYMKQARRNLNNQ